MSISTIGTDATNALAGPSGGPSPKRQARALESVVRGAIKAAGVSQREVAARLGISTTTLGRRLAPSGRTFTYPELRALADIVGGRVSAWVEQAERLASGAAR